MAHGKRYGSLAVTTYQLLIDPLLSPLRPRIAQLCTELRVKTVLDIASGTGAQCRALGKFGIDATGVDLSADMIGAAQARGGRNVHYIRGSAFDLPFDNASFDACLFALALHEHTEEERVRMLSEAVRASRRFVLVADYERPHRAWLNPAWQMIRFVEASAGPEHHAGFQEFTANGCLTGLLHRHGLHVTHEHMSHFGTIKLSAFSIGAQNLCNDGSTQQTRRSW